MNTVINTIKKYKTTTILLFVGTTLLLLFNSPSFRGLVLGTILSLTVLSVIHTHLDYNKVRDLLFKNMNTSQKLILIICILSGFIAYASFSWFSTLISDKEDSHFLEMMIISFLGTTSIMIEYQLFTIGLVMSITPRD